MKKTKKSWKKSGTTPDGVRLWALTPSLEVRDDGNYQRDAPEAFLKKYT
jgi:hypothetical protein